METQPLAELVPVNDTVAQKQLAEFIANNRQHLPPAPERLVIAAPVPSPEAEQQAAEREQRNAERAEARRRAEIQERYHGLVKAAGERYRSCTLVSFETRTEQQRKVVASLKEYISADSSEGVILYGPVGTGKDHLAFAICKEAIRSGKTVQWINGQKWFGNIRDAMDTSRTEDSLIAELARPDVLCISDPVPPVGALTQHQSTMLYRLVDARYSKGLPTICTINVSSDEEADERLGAATWDRLCHDAWKLSCNWPSYRRPAREI